jgi:hypothetical protein
MSDRGLRPLLGGSPPAEPAAQPPVPVPLRGERPAEPAAQPPVPVPLRGERPAEPAAQPPVSLRGEARDVALAEAQAVLAMVHDETRRERLADLVAAADAGEVDGDDAEALEELLELGLQTGRLRALYGPGGEQAALQTYRRLPRGAGLSASAREVSRALGALAGKPLESISLQAVGPGAFTLSLAADGVELSVRLDRQGARIASVGV